MKIRDLEWWIVGALGITAFALAIIGFNVMFSAAGVERNLLDLAFQSMKIFGMEFVDEFQSPLPWQLEIARWLAPLVLLYAAVKAIIYFIRREYNSFLMKFYKDHFIITSLNDKTRFLVTDLLKLNHKVIVIAGIDSSSKLDLLEKEGAVIVEGDIQKKSFLKDIAAHNAKHIMFIEDDDELNISNAIAVYNYLEKFGKDKKQNLHVHVADDLKHNELKELSFFEEFASNTNIQENCDIRLFSINERTSRLLFHKFVENIYKPLDPINDPQIHVALIGSNDLTLSMIIRFARLGWFGNLKIMRITLFHEGDDIIRKLISNFPKIHELIDLKTVETNLEVFDIDAFVNQHSTHNFNAAYILCKNDSLATNILNKISKPHYTNKLEVVLTLLNPDGILNKHYTGSLLKHVHLHKFNIIEESFTCDAIVSENLDTLAKIIHKDYLKKQKINPNEPSHQPWAYLPQDFKNQNREQADHLYVKLKAMNCKPVHINTVDEEYNYENETELIELLSELEHIRWMAQMILSGWVYNEVRNKDKKFHNNIIEYNKLTEPEKDWDRNAVRNMGFLLKQIGQKIVKVN